MEFSKLISERFSCKGFGEKQISQEQLEEILNAGRLAPTAKNQQPQHIYVLQSKEMLEKVDSVTPCRYNAPTVLVVAYKKDSVFTYPGSERTSGVEDATIVATHMLLAAKNAGVDSCWLNAFNPDNAHKILDLPEDEEIVMLMDLGFAADGVVALETHTDSKELDDIVTYIK